MILVELIGSHEARISGDALPFTEFAASRKACVCGTLARRLAADGVDETRRKRVMRDGVRVFARDDTVAQWAQRTVRHEPGAPRIVKYAPVDRDEAFPARVTYEDA